jgi:hypothetical protein
MYVDQLVVEWLMDYIPFAAGLAAKAKSSAEASEQ